MEMIWHCISTSAMRMLWNGEVLEEFESSRGIRQVAVNQSIWKPIRLNRRGPSISHLAFADDLILFAEENMEQVHIIQTILKLFCRSSEQKVSLDKSKVFFSKNVVWHTKLQFSGDPGIAWTNDLGKYLGVTIIHKRASKRIYQFILNKVGQRLNNWKAKTHSFSGRVSLAKSVLQALPSYVMQSTYLPKCVMILTKLEGVAK
ncbi:putative ribonuclease H protein, partial [Mucuna pruriens]